MSVFPQSPRRAGIGGGMDLGSLWAGNAWGGPPTVQTSTDSNPEIRGVFWDASSLWWPPSVPLDTLARELVDLVHARSAEVKQVFVAPSQVGTEDEREALHQLGFDVHTADFDSCDELSNAILLALWDLERQRPSPSPSPSSSAASPSGSASAAATSGATSPSPQLSVLVATSNPAVAPLLKKLRNRSVHVQLVTELSGRRGRQPVGMTLRQNANTLFDWTDLCVYVAARCGVSSPPSSPAAVPAPHPLDQAVAQEHTAATTGESHSTGTSHRRVLQLQSSEDGGAPPPMQSTTPRECTAASNAPPPPDRFFPPTPGNAKGLSKRKDFDDVPAMDQLRRKAWSTESLESVEDLKFSSAQVEMRLEPGQRLEGGSVFNNNSLLEAPPFARSASLNTMLDDCRVRLQELRKAWADKDHRTITRLLQIFSKGGFDMEVEVHKLMLSACTGAPASAPAPPATTPKQQQQQQQQSSAGGGAAGGAERDSDALAAEQCSLVMACLGYLYDRFVEYSKSALKLDAARLLISALEKSVRVCPALAVQVTNEHFQGTVTELVHTILPRVAALSQANRLLALANVPDPIPILVPYAQTWMRSPDQFSSASAYHFAFTTGLMDEIHKRRFEGFAELHRSNSFDLSHAPRHPSTPGHASNSAVPDPLLGPVDAPPHFPLAGPVDIDALGHLGGAVYQPKPPLAPPVPSAVSGGGAVGFGRGPPGVFVPGQGFVPAAAGARPFAPAAAGADGGRASSADSLSALVLGHIEPVAVVPTSLEDRLLDLLCKHPDGVLGSDVPRFYADEYGERLMVPEHPVTRERPKLKDFLLSLPGVATFTRNTQPVFVAVPSAKDGELDDQPVLLPPVDHALVRQRLLHLLTAASLPVAGAADPTPPGVLGAQLPSKYLEAFGASLRLEHADGSKAKLKEYLLSDAMAAFLRRQQPPVRISLIKAGHDRRYFVVPDAPP